MMRDKEKICLYHCSLPLCSETSKQCAFIQITKHGLVIEDIERRERQRKYYREHKVEMQTAAEKWAAKNREARLKYFKNHYLKNHKQKMEAARARYIPVGLRAIEVTQGQG